MNPGARHSDLPLTLYESIIDLVKGEARMLFVKLAFTLATEEAERIGLDHVIILLEININFFETYQGEIVNIKRWPGLKEVLNIFQVARISGASDMSRESRVSEHFTVQHSAIKMLSSRLAIIRDYVLAVESGKEGIFNASKISNI